MLERPDVLYRLGTERHATLLREGERARTLRLPQPGAAFWHRGLARAGAALAALGWRLKRRKAPAIRTSVRYFPFPPFE